MASILSLGGGASEGLDTVLARMMAEQKQREVERAALKDEEIRRQQIEESAATRKQAQISLDASRDVAAENTRADNVRGILGMRQAGTEVDPATYDYETKHGAPPDFYLKEAKYAPDFEGPTQDPRDTQVIKFKGVRTPNQTADSNQEHTYKITDPALAKQFGKKVGDVIDASYDPKTRQVLYRDLNVTNGVDHYEKPPAPDRVLIQTGSGYETRADATKKLQTGGTVPLATTSSTRTMQEGASMVQPHIDSIKAQAEDLDKAGLFGPVMSRLRDIATHVGSIDEFWDSASSDPELQKMDKRAGRFATSLGLLASGAARVHYGGRAGSSPEAIKGFKAMMSDAGTLDLFEGRIQGLDDFLTTYAAGPPVAGSKPAAAQAPAERERTYDPATGTLK